MLDRLKSYYRGAASIFSSDARDGSRIGDDDVRRGARPGSDLPDIATSKAVYRCVTLISQSIAQCSLRARDPETLIASVPGTTTSSGARFNQIFRRGPSGMSEFEFLEAVIVDLLTCGSGMVRFKLNRNRGFRLEGIEYLDPRRVVTARSESGVRMFIDENGMPMRPSEVVWMRLPRLGRRTGSLYDDVEEGCPPIANADLAFQTGRSLDRWVNKLFDRDPRTDLMVSLDRVPSDEQILQIHDQATEYTKNDRPWFQPPGMTVSRFEPVTRLRNVPETRDYQVAEVARAYGMPLEFLGLEKMENFEISNRQLVRFCLRLIMTRIEQAFMMKLPGYPYIRFDELDLIRGDLATVSEAMSMLMGPNASSVVTYNEVRRLISLPPVPDGDRLIDMQSSTSE